MAAAAAGRFGGNQAAWRSWPLQGTPQALLNPLGWADLTSAGRLPFKGIIHVAGINMLWRASEWSIRECVRNAMALAHEKGFQSIAFPLIGAGSGGFNQERTRAIMEDELGKMEYPMEVRLVVFKRTKG